ncbi:MAG TPA: META domain-containing protein [Puia sp.]|nr:META domain-containing protein [Puia sp.]
MKCFAVICFSLFACQSPTEAPSTRSPIDHARDSPAKTDPGAPSKMTPTPKDTTTLGGVWWLQPVLASDTASGKTPWLDLDLAKSHFTGNTGCNSMRGDFWFSGKDSSLSFSEKIVQTKMACPGYNEAAFMKSLRSAGHYRLRNGVLTLLSDNNTELSRWARKTGAGPKALKT